MNRSLNLCVSMTCSFKDLKLETVQAPSASGTWYPLPMEKGQVSELQPARCKSRGQQEAW